MIQELNPLGPEDPEEEESDPEETYTMEFTVPPGFDPHGFFEFIIGAFHDIGMADKDEVDGKDMAKDIAYAIKTARLVNSKGDDWHTTKEDYEELLT